jgi:hypothetical protein
MSGHSHIVEVDQEIPLKILAEKFAQWVENRKGVSSVYEFIVGKLIEDRELLRFISKAGDVPFIYNRFLGAVHYLLLEGVDSPLRSYFGTVTEQPQPISESAYLYFRQLCLQHEQEILKSMVDREVQINEVRRCAALLPSLTLASQRHQSRPLALIDVGACAGLNLLFDQYHYEYGRAGMVGASGAPVRISCKPEGETLPPVPASFPAVRWRRGLDLHPVDATDSHQTNWLIALVSPDDRDRLTLLRAALDLARRAPPVVIKGDASTATAELLAEVPAGLVPCVFHSFTTQDLKPNDLRRFEAILRQYGGSHDLCVISLEWERLNDQVLIQRPIPLKLTCFRSGAETQETLALVDNRGWCEWIEWLR